MAVAEDLLDATGLLCPLPVLRARKRLLALPAGALLVVWADDPAASRDMPAFCREAGHDLIATDRDGTKLIFTIRRG